MGIRRSLFPRTQAQALELHRLIAESSTDVIGLVTPTGRVVHIGPGALALTGRDPAELVGARVLAAIHPAEERAASEAWDRARAGACEAFAHRVRHADGSWRWLEGWARGARLQGRPRVLLALRDVTARKRVEALRDGERRVLERIAAGAPLEETLTVLAEVVEGQTEGMSCSVLLLEEDGIHVRHGAAPSLPESYTRQIDGASIGPEAGSCGTAMYRREAVFVTDVMTSPLWEGYKELAAAHGLRACWSIPILSSRGRVLGSFAMYYGEPRSPSSAELSLLEVAPHLARIAIERRQLEEELRQALKMESIGQLAGGIAHDFNNLLTVINGCGELLLSAQAGGSVPDVLEAAREIVDAGKRAAALTEQLLAFSRRQLLHPVVLDPNEVVAGVERLLRRLLSADVGLETELDPAVWSVKVDRGQLEQVLLNLAINARDAMPSGGRIAIRTENVQLDARAAPSGVETGPYVRLMIADSGLGMSEEVRARVFEPFFTTKGTGRGTGLGLSTVYGIVRQSGGHIDVTSRQSEGSVFRILLPRAQEEAAASALPAETAAPFVRGTILVAEDETGVRELVCRVLEREGHEVLAARDGNEALRLSRCHGPIDLLLTDVIMPEMGGLELARRLAEDRPEMRVLFVSGYNDDSRGSLGPKALLLPKPFTPADLSSAVRQAMSADPRTALAD